MKAKYLFAAVAAAFTMGCACVSCDVDQDPDTYLSEIKVSTSYVSLDVEGGSAKVEITANADWYLQNVPSWLTIDPMEGKAGKQVLTFSAEQTYDGRSAEVLLTLADSVTTQRINVIQGLSVVSSVTCAEVLAGPDSKTYQVTGVVTAIANLTPYGNFYLNDGTGEIYIYGTADKDGKTKNGALESYGIGVGDKVTVQGPKTTYNGTVELVDVSVIKIVKSLIKVEEGGSNAFDANGGDFLVRLGVSGDGVSISIADEAKSWLSISDIEKTDSTTNVTFHVAENTAESSRTATIEFTTASGSSSSTVSATVSQQGLMGTLTNPFTVEQAIAYCQTLTATSANDFYVKGKVSRIVNEFGSKYGNGTFWMSDDGTYSGSEDNKTPGATDFEAYQVYWFDNQPWVEGNAQVAVGDEVVICGKLTNYKGTSETSGKNAYVYSVNGVRTDANGLGSAVSPFTVAGVKAAIDGGVADSVYVQGIVSKVVNAFGTKYGNGTFWISADGTYAGSEDNKTPGETDFEAYQVYWLGNKAWTEADAQIEVGDKVVLRGLVTKYNTTYETSSKKAYVYSVEK